MNLTATELMKRLKFLEEEIAEIHRLDEEKSAVLVEKKEDATGKTSFVPLYEEAYDFAENRKRVEELFSEERKIRLALHSFNVETKIEGFGFTLAEGLVRLGQLKSEIKVLTNLAKKGQYSSSTSYNGDVVIYRSSYSAEEAKKALRAAQKELSALQVAIDKTNLTSKIEFAE